MLKLLAMRAFFDELPMKVVFFGPGLLVLSFVGWAVKTQLTTGAGATPRAGVDAPALERQVATPTPLTPAPRPAPGPLPPAARAPGSSERADVPTVAAKPVPPPAATRVTRAAKPVAPAVARPAPAAQPRPAANPRPGARATSSVDARPAISPTVRA
ncbi:MAG TPA: hypothetical protein VNT60_06065, partial [Deinococcales bacterium]|nr:hypothetical protein [Deinococcales bacterium]